jgi:hypothetical protein
MRFSPLFFLFGVLTLSFLLHMPPPAHAALPLMFLRSGATTISPTAPLLTGFVEDDVDTDNPWLLHEDVDLPEARACFC